MPHLIQAAELRWRFQELARLAQRGEHLLNRATQPVLVINEKRRSCFLTLRESCGCYNVGIRIPISPR